MTLFIYHQATLEASCPRCTVSEGTPCRTPRGRKSRVPHSERVHRYLQTMPMGFCPGQRGRHLWVYFRGAVDTDRRFRRCKYCKRLEHCTTPYGLPTVWIASKGLSAFQTPYLSGSAVVDSLRNRKS